LTSKRHLHVLALNSGSSSLKFGLYDVGRSSVRRLVAGELEGIDAQHGAFHAVDASGDDIVRETLRHAGIGEAIARIARLFTGLKTPQPQVIGHRIVHGGPRLRRSCVIDAAILDLLESAVVFAPLHLPAALSIIRFSMTHFPKLPQIACFDTSFHSHMPDIARVLPIPRELRTEGVERYGFHGLSCESIVRQLAEELPALMVIAHLGNGASITAVRDGRSVDTSMGLTPTGGILMGTRSGDLDPGVLVYLARQRKLDASGLEVLVDRQSGLLGISGVSADLRLLHRAAHSNADARLSLDMFCYCAAKSIAGMSAAALGGVAGLVFTGGIGENDAEVRLGICRRLALIGVHLDHALNLLDRRCISDTASPCRVLVLPCKEDEQIALHARSLGLDLVAEHRQVAG
jgi:acetate kinase